MLCWRLKIDVVNMALVVLNIDGKIGARLMLVVYCVDLGVDINL